MAFIWTRKIEYDSNFIVVFLPGKESHIAFGSGHFPVPFPVSSAKDTGQWVLGPLYKLDIKVTDHFLFHKRQKCVSLMGNTH